MKHAFLVTAYRDVQGLKDLIMQILEINDSQIYINIDKRSSSLKEEILKFCETYSSNRIHIKYDKTIHWGSFQHLRAFIDLFQLALESKCEYFHTITGQCRITKTPEGFLEFFNKNKGYSFIEFFPLPTSIWPGNGGLNRIKYYHLHEFLDFKKNGKLANRLNKHLIHLQKVFLINRLRKITYYGGSGYFSLNQAAATYFLENFYKLESTFKHSFCAEEIAPQTILCNSPKELKIKLINNNLRFINWQEKNGETPGILDESDFEKIKNSNFLFARKFDSKISKELIIRLFSKNK